MAQAVWNGAVIAESDDYETVEGNIYFPPEAVHQEYLHDSDNTSHCSWKGEASYKTIVVDGKEAPDAAWFYPNPSKAAANISGHFAFWRGVRVVA